MGNSLQEAGLVLTKKLQDYWTNRVTRLETEYSPIYNNLKSLSTQEQWNTIEDNLEKTSRELNRTKKKENQTTQPTTNYQPQQPSQKKHHIHRFKKPKPPITNLSSHTLTKHQISLLSRGLNFIPTAKKDHPAKILQYILLFDRKLRLRYHFYHSDSDPDPNTTTITDHTINTILNPSSGWTPPSGQDPFLDTYRSSITNEFIKELDTPSPRFKKNLKKEEYQAMKELHMNNDIVINPADKGG